MNNAALLSRLRAAWGEPLTAPETHAATEAGSEADRAGVAELDAIKAAGVATERCRWHLPPFDALEEPDRLRPGYIRSTCRLCGTFLGYRSRPAEVSSGSRS
jgi:hypothetical protein